MSRQKQLQSFPPQDMPAMWQSRVTLRNDGT